MKYLFSLAISALLVSNLSSQKVVLLEKWTNSHCGVCPNGAIELQEIVDYHPNTIWVSHYKPWMMVLNNDQSDQLWSDFGVYANPLLMVDREYNNGLFNNMSTWFGIVSDELNEEQVAEVEITNLYTNAFERTIDFDCNISFLKDQENAEYRITAMVVEDLVTGEPQDSYFSDTPGHPLYGLGSEIWNYKHRNVVRHIFDDAWGTPDVLPTEPKAGDAASHHYQFSIPDDHNIENMFIVCSITKYNPQDLTQIDALQATKQKLIDGVITSTDELNTTIDLDIFPNPTSSYVDVILSESIDELKIIDPSGRLMFSEKQLAKNPRIDISNFESGYYLIQIKIEDRWITRPLSVVTTK